MEFARALDIVDACEAARGRIDARMLEALAALDAQWPDDPAIPDLTSELAVRLGISARTASERLRIARALRELPEIARAHREGRLSWDQLRWVSRFATPETDPGWAERAPGMRPDALRLESLRQDRRRREAADRDHAMRSFRTEWDEEQRFLSLSGTLAAEQGRPSNRRSSRQRSTRSPTPMRTTDGVPGWPTRSLAS